MQTVKFGEISAVAFDIDGTLYRDFGFRIRVWPYIVAHCKFFIKYGKVRKQLREKDFYEDFNLAQAQMVAEAMGCSAEKAQAMLEKNVYIGLRKYYARLNACKGALKLICRLKDAGVKIAVLSDFPPEQKGDIWGIKEKCDLVLGSEQTGCLKPSPYVYKILEEKLETPAEKILYVGDGIYPHMDLDAKHDEMWLYERLPIVQDLRTFIENLDFEFCICGHSPMITKEGVLNYIDNNFFTI